MSGHRRGLLPALMRTGLSVASVPYRIAIAYRNRSFDQGRRSIETCGVPVISVGNLTTGGTGKTPVVAYLARWFRDHSLRVAIVSRGYGRGDADENDEAAELHQRLPDVPHVQDPDRVEAARIAVEELESELILMDDGFQHRRLHRDLDIVLIDMTCPFGYGHLLPRGLLREPMASLSRADVALLTRCDQVTMTMIDEVTRSIHDVNSNILVLRSSHRPSGLLQYPNRVRPVSELQGKRVVLISGIGNPDAFQRTVQDAGGIVVNSKTLKDHANYDRKTVQEIEDFLADQHGIELLVCTQKDLVKLQADRLGGLPIVALTIDADLEPSSKFDAMLMSVVS